VVKIQRKGFFLPRAIKLNILNQELTDQSLVLGDLLKKKKLVISFAESCTGGLVCKSMTDQAGASEYLQGGVVTYSNEMKMKLLKVTKSTLEKHGAVSQETALEMVRGASRLFETDVSGAVTGIAGPEGGTEEKPVGTVWFAVGDEDKSISEMKRFDGNREEVRIQSAIHLIKMLINIILEAK